jgi:crossover junction endodeoxyribonuclease RuvC
LGVTSAFQFGRGYGAVEGVIAALGWPVEYVTPQKWKNALNVPTEKDDARARACQLLPLDAEHWTPRRGVFDKDQASGRAEAALIALYGVRA